MSKAKLAYAIWPWGLEKDQMIQGMQDIKAVGFNYFESVSSAVDMFRDTPAEFKAIQERCRVHPVSFYFGSRGEYAKDVAKVEASLGFLAANKITCINVAAAWKDGGGATMPELKAELGRLQKIGKLCKPYGICPCLHPHINTRVMFESDLDFIMQNSDPSELFFGPDTAHMALGRCDPVEICDRYKTRIRLVHLKDVVKRKAGDGASDKHGGFKMICDEGPDKQGIEVFSDFLELGEGTVNFPAIFKILESVGYDSYLIVELDSSRFGNKESAAMSMKFMQAHGFH